MKPGAQKIAWAGLAICCFVASALVDLMEARMGLLGFGGWIVGKIGAKRPGDVPSESGRFDHPKAGAAVLLVGLPLLGCAHLSEVDWPKFAECGEPAADLLAEVLRVLLAEAQNGPGISKLGEQRMVKLAEQYGTEAVFCAIRMAQEQGHPAAAEYLEAME